MRIIALLLLMAAVFGLCWLVDKAFTKAFRSKAQHMSGMAVRASKRYGLFGLVLMLLGILCLINGAGSALLLVGGTIVGLVGIAMVVYYLTYGIFYDGETFLISSFGKKDRVYNYNQIRGQRLFLIQGGSVVVELHMTDATTVSIQSQHQGAYTFLDTAFAGWCIQKGLDPRTCDFHNPDNSCWFPTVEDL